MKNVGMISLGCDKNRVDGENILFSFKKAGYNIVNDVNEADVIVVNTCAFIEDAKKESIDAVLDCIAVKLKSGRKPKLVVSGCMTERYAKELQEGLSEVDVFVGINSYHDIVNVVESGKKLEKADKYVDYEKGRVITTPYHYAYLKIADGCDNFCSYCAIPYIRGAYRSTAMEPLLDEADRLVSEGVKELILVAQDITRYGLDLYGELRLKPLISKLLDKDFIKIRLLYAYPELIDDELIEMISGSQKIAKYIDVPLQHIDENVLRRMNRRSNPSQIYGLLDKIKKINSEIALRSSFIVGFPRESEEEFAKLRDFIKEGFIDYAGFFSYSKEEGTDAFNMEGQLNAKLKKQRTKELSVLQSQNIVQNHQKYVGKVQKIIYEGIDYTRNRFYGRNEFNAPDIDTKVLFTSDFPVEIGEYYDVLITDNGFHLSGKTVRRP